MEFCWGAGGVEGLSLSSLWGVVDMLGGVVIGESYIGSVEVGACSSTHT